MNRYPSDSKYIKCLLLSDNAICKANPLTEFELAGNQIPCIVRYALSLRLYYVV